MEETQNFNFKYANHISTKGMKNIKILFFGKKCEKPPFSEFQNFSKCGERGVIMVFMVKCGFFSPEIVFFSIKKQNKNLNPFF